MGWAKEIQSAYLEKLWNCTNILCAAYCFAKKTADNHHCNWHWRYFSLQDFRKLECMWLDLYSLLLLDMTKVFFFPNHKYTYYSPCGYIVFVPRMLSKKKAKHNMNMHTKTPPESIITSSFREKTSWVHQIPQWFMVSDMVILHIHPQDFKLQLFSP